MKNFNEIKIDVKKYEKEITDNEVTELVCYLGSFKSCYLSNEELLLNVWKCKKYLNCISSDNYVSRRLEEVKNLYTFLLNILRNTYVVKLDTYEEILSNFKKVNDKCNSPIFKNMEHFKFLKEQNINILSKKFNELKLDEKYYEVDEELMNPKYEDLKKQYSILLYVEPEEIENKEPEYPFGPAFRVSK